MDFVKAATEVQEKFDQAIVANKNIATLYEKVRNGTATYIEANRFASISGQEIGKILAKHLRELSIEGVITQEIAEGLIPPALRQNYDYVSNVTKQIQSALNQKAGIGIKAVAPEFNQDRVEGIIKETIGKENFSNFTNTFIQQIENISMAIVDDAVKENAEFHYRAGLNPKIKRATTGKGCKWCQNLAGVYDYEDVKNAGNPVFRRHRACRCIVSYDPGDGTKQNVHTKQWSEDAEPGKIGARKQVGLESLAKEIAGHPKRLAAFSPGHLKVLLENNGLEVQPLKRGHLKNISFEDGGGFKVNFEDGGLLQYHPAERSHHGGAYYKISTGKGGTHRYDLDGNEIDD